LPVSWPKALLEVIFDGERESCSFHSTKYILAKHCSREIITPFANGHAISLTNKADDFMMGKK